MNQTHHMSERAIAFLLASLLCGYPDDAFLKNIEILLDDEKTESGAGEFSSTWPKLRKQLSELLNHPERIDDIRGDYVATFDRGRSISPLYESEYGRGRSLAKGNDLADISGFYKAFGFTLGDMQSNYEMFDHISVELEFYALLVAKQDHLFSLGNVDAVEIILDARRKFLDSHLGRFAPSVARQVATTGNEYFKTVYNWVAELVTHECQCLDVVPDIVPLVSEHMPDIACGGHVAAAFQ